MIMLCRKPKQRAVQLGRKTRFLQMARIATLPRPVPCRRTQPTQGINIAAPRGVPHEHRHRRRTIRTAARQSRAALFHALKVPLHERCGCHIRVRAREARELIKQLRLLFFGFVRGMQHRHRRNGVRLRHRRRPRSPGMYSSAQARPLC